MNGKFWRAVLKIIIAAAIIAVVSGTFTTLFTVIEIKTTLDIKLPEIDRRLLALEVSRRGRP